MNLNKGLEYLSSVDSQMKVLISSFPKPRFPSYDNYFSSLVKYIIYQQLNSKSAFAIFTRYKMLFKNENYKNPTFILSKNDSHISKAT